MSGLTPAICKKSIRNMMIMPLFTRIMNEITSLIVLLEQ
jgi:hypothetical protein